ncbi:MULTISPECIES: cytochrome c biogenesis protein DipZ [Pseudomonas]|mgnify:FL=1|jgi:cytochrome c biogenesis protein CcdA/thiol-disulfide isomerase/thioredoxin|uniref:cytochrome c biogenesis protein DipZ n=1 Tax=Pseudomonas TaxID=286 RepID=UPI000B361D34|nr:MULTISPECIES: cytochrome c biogenesis protein DipZ [Pseudomonas]MBD9607004.1 cytochrome c biogenesis protein DipZ [Pseudomonas sp. PDM08]MDR7107176.1 cytochrome c biogenesis protein CcdA/thiol-disulfide isomerase/thioredoxin [Pseudomonas frederiksbergensis]PMY46639.1 cytochrome c biogenesis protein DipZ [Pseudomonas sp. FW305-53]PMY89123.1 cytochrome c biogenesis protein DipZ [Pseudomonas sp. FW303-C2]PMY93260.1 cytochrome c biogenesis protein DipZ [Pseudomonas sp. FW305-62]
MFLIAFLGGILTVLSPCILPVVPFLFAGVKRTRTSILLTLGGMALTFALISSLAVVSSDWVIQANNTGRHVALIVMVLFALSLISARIGGWLARPFVLLGNRLDPNTRKMSGPLGSVMIGVATGLLWAPCAGPILGVILTGAMLQGANVQTSLLLVAYGLGSALSLGTLIFAGRGLVNRLKPSIPVTGWLRRGAGAGVLVAAAVIATGTDNRLLAGTSSEGVTTVEQQVLETVPKVVDYLVSKVKADPMDAAKGAMPSLSGAVEWLNSPALSNDSLRGKVVLVDFWTYDCINCQHTLPYVKDWAKKYEKDGLVVIGVHTPEYGYERILDNVRDQVKKLGITYPVAIDNNYAIWRAFDNQYWPAHYLIDAKGQVRYSHFGEGRYETQEQMIRQLLEEAKAPAA